MTLDIIDLQRSNRVSGQNRVRGTLALLMSTRRGWQEDGARPSKLTLGERAGGCGVLAGRQHSLDRPALSN